MTLYSRSDLTCVAIPRDGGGCGEVHIRPVHNGAPEKIFRLDCLPCESYLKGDRKPKILRTTPGDAKAGIPAKQERVADCDPHWSSTPESIPLTPDELKTNATRTERATSQIQMIQALAALRAAGVDVPYETQWLMDRELPQQLIKGTTVCATGHDNAAGVKFCGECGISMSPRNEIEAADIPLDMLHIATLRKKCREQGLPDKGKKEELIARLMVTI
jgi:hypothetical protein